MSWRVSASSMASAVSMQVRGMAVPGLVLLGGAGLGEAVGVGAGLDDVAAEGEAVDDGGAEAGVGEGLGPAAEGLVGGNGDARLFLPFRQNLEEELGAAAVEFDIAELVDLCGRPHSWTYADTATMPMCWFCGFVEGMRAGRGSA